MQVRQALLTVGFDVRLNDGLYVVGRGAAKVPPLKTNESDWTVQEQVFWEDQVRTGLFLVCYENDGVAAQAFDLTASDAAFLPAAKFEEVPKTVENINLFGEPAAKRLTKGKLLKTDLGVLIGWVPEDNAAVVMLRLQPVWYAASSEKDAVFQFQTGAVRRCYEIESAVGIGARVLQ